MTKKQKAEQERCREELRKFIKPGDTVYTILQSVSRSGMTRHIRPIVMQDGEPRWIGYMAGQAIGARTDREGNVILSGCGMDMGFSLVYNLSYALHPDGFECIGKNCPSNDHTNGDRDRTPHHHKDGGYSLRQRWM